VTRKHVRHILSLSGGKDSTALAIYLRDRIPDLEYVFCDTEEELPETYSFIDLLEAYLGKSIHRIKHDGRDFHHWWVIYRTYLPSSQMRWCTKHLKIEPFEAFVGDDPVVSYVGIRADEDREGYISTKPNIKAVFPFKEDGKTKQDIYEILDGVGLELPGYYNWRSRSGCYFCFFQQKFEWVGLLENHPELFEKAKAYEKVSEDGTQFTWQQGESLEELARPERVAQIKAEHAVQVEREKARATNQSLLQILGNVAEANSWDRPCTICSI